MSGGVKTDHGAFGGVHTLYLLGEIILRSADPQAVRKMKIDIEGRRILLSWPDAKDLAGVAQLDPGSSRLVAACSLALAAWKWALDKFVWMAAASLPFHPFGFVC